MIIDTSALVAILLGEPEAEPFALAMAADSKRLISAFTAIEILANFKLPLFAQNLFSH